MRRFFGVVTVGIAVLGCERSREQAPVEAGSGAPVESVDRLARDVAPEAAESPELVAPVAVDPEAIRRAALAYVREQTAIEDVTVEIEATAGGWARVRVLPASEVTDPAILYLRALDGAWEGVAIGTAFAPEDLDRLGVPAAVRPAA